MKAGFFGSVTMVVAVFSLVLLGIENAPLGDRFADYCHCADLVVWGVFALDVLCRVAASPQRLGYLRRHWPDLIVFVGLLQFLEGWPQSPAIVILRQGISVVMLVTRARNVGDLLSHVSLRPAQMMALGFLLAIAIGTVLLMHPAATVAGARTPWVNALFTATSATCVTGLAVVDTGTYFSTFGQVVILGLIQVGGLGIMTFAASLAFVSGKTADIRQRVALQDALDYDVLAGVRRLIMFILAMTFTVELLGAAALTLAWKSRFGSLTETLYHAVFHAISAFCNAGFSTFSDSLIGFVADPVTNVTICLLVIAGGLGFTVIQDLLGTARRRLRAPGNHAIRLRVQTRIVLSVSFLLVAGGAAAVYFLERDHAFRDLPWRGQVLAAVFQSVTARTAGFNSCDLAGLTSATLFITMLLMFIGGSPGSTAGGIKTTSVAVLWAVVSSGVRQRATTELYQRTIPDEVIRKALFVLCLSLAVLAGFVTALLCLETIPAFDLLFETVSAFGTVGLSTGATSHLSVPGRLLVTILMFIGRLGPLTMAYALASAHRAGHYAYAEERVMIG